MISIGHELGVVDGPGPHLRGAPFFPSCRLPARIPLLRCADTGLRRASLPVRMPLLADVAMPVPLSQPFTYAVPAELLASVRPGARVLCEFGRRRLVGVVLSVADRPWTPPPSAALGLQ